MLQDFKKVGQEYRQVKVWDLPVRLFHWGLVGCVIAALVTGFLLEDRWLDVHVWAGYGVAGLVGFRLVWGLIGSTYARFSSFIFSPAQTLSHAKGILKGRSEHHTGHNPAGAAMIFALLAVLGGLVFTGVIVLGGQENLGALAGYVSYSIGHGVGEFHEVLAGLLLALIGGHLAGMVFESWLSKENLAKAMVTGRKLARGDVKADSRKSVLARFFISMVLVLGIGFGGYSVLAAKPPSGLVSMPINKTYASECGDCHYAYHPSLLPSSSWAKIMTSLGDHFGEDAGLDKATVKNIAGYLARFSSEKWDTEVANRLRKVSDKNPLSITATRFWTKKHRGIDKTVFSKKAVGSKGNCVACHRDADSGRFDDHEILVP